MWNWILSIKSHRGGPDSQSQWLAWDSQWERLNYWGESLRQLPVQDFLLLLLLLLRLRKGAGEVLGVHSARGWGRRQPDQETSATEVPEAGGPTGGDQSGDHQQQTGGGRETEDGGKCFSSDFPQGKYFTSSASDHPRESKECQIFQCENEVVAGCERAVPGRVRSWENIKLNFLFIHLESCRVSYRKSSWDVWRNECNVKMMQSLIYSIISVVAHLLNTIK